MLAYLHNKVVIVTKLLICLGIATTQLLAAHNSNKGYINNYANYANYASGYQLITASLVYQTQYENMRINFTIKLKTHCHEWV